MSARFTILAMALVALAMTPGGFSDQANDMYGFEGANGTCIVMDSVNILDNSSKTCLACQLQCLGVSSCSMMSFEGANITRSQLPTYRCQETQIGSHVDLCVEVVDGFPVSAALRTCKACMRRCASVGVGSCSNAVWAGQSVAHANLETYELQTCPPEPSPSPYNPPSPSPYMPSPVLPSPSTAPLNCSEPVAPGPCRASFESYFYNATSEACEEFIYGGCDGNTNRFETLLDCQAGCAPASPSPALPPSKAPPAPSK